MSEAPVVGPVPVAWTAVQGFSAALNRVPVEMRPTFTYDQGRELVRRAEITQRPGTAIHFADPHSPWQRAINENTNGLAPMDV